MSNDAEKNATTDKDGKRLFKFVFNINKKSEDETEMTKDFNADVQHYVDYDDAAGKCFQVLENCYIPVGGKANGKDDDDAFQLLSVALANYLPHAAEFAAKIESFSINMKTLHQRRKTHQNAQKYEMRHLRRFHVDDFKKFLAQRKAFDESRKRMDQAKAEVRDAKTTAQIEKKAACYQMAVDDFDTQTEMLIKIIDALPKIKQVNCRDILLVLVKHKLYHADVMAFYKI